MEVRRAAVEMVVATGVVLAANAGHAVDALIGRSLATMQQSGSTFTVELKAATDIQVPQRVTVGFSREAENRQSLCVFSTDGRHPQRLDLDDSNLPYHVNVRSAADSFEGDRMSLVPACDEADNVIVDVSLDPDVRALLQEQRYSDTITLFVFPE